jgi:hypothetical protein
LDHFGVVEVPDVHKDRDLETYGRTVDLKCDTNLLIPLASRIDLDACHCDLKFAHPVARAPWGCIDWSMLNAYGNDRAN